MSVSKNDVIITSQDYDILLEARELFLFNDDIDGSDAATFIKNLRILESKKGPIVIHQYSNGGEIQAGMAIYDAIKSSTCSFLFLTYGSAASMGSLIPQAVYGKGYRVTMPSCVWLIHEGYVAIENSKRAVNAYIESEKISTNNMYDIYANVCQHGEYFKGDKPSIVKNFIKKKLLSKEDWWLTSNDAVFYGFADAVFGQEGYEDINKIKGYL